MLHLLGKIIVDTVVAVTVAAIADIVTKETTGKHIHEHVFKWYDELRDDVLKWAHENPKKKVSKYTIQLVDKSDGVVSSARKKLKLRAHTSSGRSYTVSERSISEKEIYQKFPGLKKNKIQTLTI